MAAGQAGEGRFTGVKSLGKGGGGSVRVSETSEREYMCAF